MQKNWSTVIGNYTYFYCCNNTTNNISYFHMRKSSHGNFTKISLHEISSENFTCLEFCPLFTNVFFILLFYQHSLSLAGLVLLTSIRKHLSQSQIVSPSLSRPNSISTSNYYLVDKGKKLPRYGTDFQIDQ